MEVGVEATEDNIEVEEGDIRAKIFLFGCSLNERKIKIVLSILT